MTRLLHLLRKVFRRAHEERELDAELRAYFDLLVEEKMRLGIPADEARRLARFEVGGLEQVKEEVRSVRPGAWVDSLVQDVRYALRMIRKNPAFSAVAVLILALGIGSNTALFSVVNSILLRPLPFRDSGRIVMLFTRDARSNRNWVSYPDYRDWQDQSRGLEEICAVVQQSVNLTKQGEPKRVIGGFVSANFFSMLGVQPSTGRDFRAGEDAPGAARVAIVSFGLWQGMLAGDPTLLGKPLVLNDAPYTIIGVMPQDFHFPWADAQVWIPYPNYPNFSQLRDRSALGAVGRIRSGVSLSEAQAEMDTIAARLADSYPSTNADRRITLVPFHDVIVEDLRPQLLMVWGMVALVLLITCANVAGLLLVRASARVHEMAVRAAIGGVRSRLLRQLLTETMILWLLGGVLGALFAYWGAAALALQIPSELASSIRVDVTALCFTLAVSAFTGLLFGLGPALGLSRVDLVSYLKHSGRSLTAGSHEWMRKGLVVAQIALAVILLASAGLVLRSLTRVLDVPLGFDERNVLTMEYRVPRTKYPHSAQQWEFHRQVVEKIRALPGVASAAVIRGLPFSGNGNVPPIEIVGRPTPPRGQEPQALIQLVSPELFQTLSIPLFRGRVLDEQDSASRPVVAVVNQTMARRFWEDADPIGHSIRIVPENITATIVGVVGDVKQFSLEDPEQLQIYLPYAQDPFIFATLVVKTQGDPLTLARTVEQAVWSVDKDQPVWKIRTLSSLVDNSLGPRRLVASLLSGFALLVLLLATLGIYGTMTFVVQQRTQEIGIRMALGGKRFDVLRLVLGQGATLAVIGLALGLTTSLILAPLMRSLLFDTRARDPFTFILVGTLLLCAMLAASFLPARRAARVDPMIALRYE